MKLIKLTDDHYVVVDETIQPVNGYYYDSFIKAIRNTSAAEYGEASHCWKITHSTQPMPHGAVREGQITGVTAISLQEVKELIGEVDVESDAEEWAWIYNQGENGKEYFKIAKEAYIAAYNQCLEDNEEYIKRATEWEVELETIDNRQPCDCSCHNNPNMVHFVACCNDGWIGKVTQKLKLKQDETSNR